MRLEGGGLAQAGGGPPRLGADNPDGPPNSASSSARRAREGELRRLDPFGLGLRAEGVAHRVTHPCMGLLRSITLDHVREPHRRPRRWSDRRRRLEDANVRHRRELEDGTAARRRRARTGERSVERFGHRVEDSAGEPGGEGVELPQRPRRLAPRRRRRAAAERAAEGVGLAAEEPRRRASSADAGKAPSVGGGAARIRGGGRRRARATAI